MLKSITTVFCDGCKQAINLDELVWVFEDPLDDAQGMDLRLHTGQEVLEMYENDATNPYCTHSGQDSNCLLHAIKIKAGRLIEDYPKVEDDEEDDDA
jgi:hypothetical protein